MPTVIPDVEVTDVPSMIARANVVLLISGKTLSIRLVVETPLRNIERKTEALNEIEL